ncbi:hypothetical protein [Lunatibacter salilacus]|uniref:hypothetical protein n=1 Tax=Lunatibacter salilacus TaxID=2483804 RepID=UPI00131B968D|nr:hypothetical protein [Lunatibacter salilacus]
MGKKIESVANEVMQQGVTKTSTNGVTVFSQAPNLSSKVQGVVDNMVNGMGQSGKTAANGLAVTNAVATGSTEVATKTHPVQNMVDYLKKRAFNWFYDN